MFEPRQFDSTPHVLNLYTLCPDGSAVDEKLFINYLDYLIFSERSYLTLNLFIVSIMLKNVWYFIFLILIKTILRVGCFQLCSIFSFQLQLTVQNLKTCVKDFSGFLFSFPTLNLSWVIIVQFELPKHRLEFLSKVHYIPS